MKITHPNVAFADARGNIHDILFGASVGHIALFSSVSGAVRGEHYHRESTAYIYVLTGSLLLKWRTENGPISVVAAGVGDLITIEPGERHRLEMIHDTLFLMMTSGPEGGQQWLNDTVREAV